MSGETLRRAAAQIRNDHGGVVSRNTRDGRRWLPVADLLDLLAKRSISNDLEHAEREQALVVARAYVGGDA